MLDPEKLGDGGRNDRHDWGMSQVVVKCGVEDGGEEERETVWGSAYVPSPVGAEITGYTSSTSPCM